MLLRLVLYLLLTAVAEPGSPAPATACYDFCYGFWFCATVLLRFLPYHAACNRCRFLPACRRSACCSPACLRRFVSILRLLHYTCLPACTCRRLSFCGSTAGVTHLPRNALPPAGFYLPACLRSAYAAAACFLPAFYLPPDYHLPACLPADLRSCRLCLPRILACLPI